MCAWFLEEFVHGYPFCPFLHTVRKRSPLLKDVEQIVDIDANAVLDPRCALAFQVPLILRNTLPSSSENSVRGVGVALGRCTVIVMNLQRFCLIARRNARVHCCAVDSKSVNGIGDSANVYIPEHNS